MSTGEVVGNVQGSEGFAYGSAVVDPVCEFYCNTHTLMRLHHSKLMAHAHSLLLLLLLAAVRKADVDHCTTRTLPLYCSDVCITHMKNRLLRLWHS